MCHYSSDGIASSYCHRLCSLEVDIEMNFKGQDIYYLSVLVKGIGVKVRVGKERN